MKPETKFRQNKVIPFLRTLKNTAYFAIQQVAKRGDPDFLLCVNGLFVGLELKKDEKTEPDPLQKSKHRYIQEKGGGYVLVACPENWEECKLFLKNLNDGGKNVIQTYLRKNNGQQLLRGSKKTGDSTVH
jgi:hypothetical protein